MDIHLFIVVSILIFFFMILFFFDGTNIALLSYQTSKNHTRFVNIHIKLAKKKRRRERENMCVCMIEFKTHARREKQIFKCFYALYETAGHVSFVFLIR
jgi:hypothetical protein